MRSSGARGGCFPGSTRRQPYCGQRKGFTSPIDPNSDVAYSMYPEIRQLSEAWTRDNEENNSGDLPRLYTLILNVRQILEEKVPGEMAELGVYRGNSAAVLAHYARASGKHLFLFDTFEGFDRRDLVSTDEERPIEFGQTSLDLVKSVVGEESVTFVKGWFPQSFRRSVQNLTVLRRSYRLRSIRTCESGVGVLLSSVIARWPSDLSRLCQSKLGWDQAGRRRVFSPARRAAHHFRRQIRDSDGSKVCKPRSAVNTASAEIAFMHAILRGQPICQWSWPSGAWWQPRQSTSPLTTVTRARGWRRR